MGIEIAKPEPIRLGNRYLYTLTSYEPVKIEVSVERTSDAEIDLTLESLAADGGIEVDALTDEWAREHTGAPSLDELKASLARERDRAVASRTEEARFTAAVTELATRLGQKVPEDEVARYRAMLLRSNELDAGALGLSLDDLLQRLGTSRAEFDRTLEEQALVEAEREAALSAFASERKLTVDESEIPYLVGQDPAHGAAYLEQMKQQGALEGLRFQCLLTKAARAVAAEATCVYVQESPEEAAKRLQAMRDTLAQMRERSARQKEPSGDAPEGPNLHLV